MISINTLQSLSDKNGIDKYSILREIIQISFLEELYKLPQSKRLFFKGGTALKILFDSNRYSEDLDFTTNLDAKEIIKIVDETASQLNKEYPKLTVKNLDTPTGISKKISLPVDISSQPMTIKLDFSQRESVVDPKSGTIFTNLPITTSSVIQHLSDEEILAEKYRAIINRIKGRDLYDFLFLLKRGVKFNLKLVNEKLNYYKEKYNPEDFTKKIKSWDEKELDSDIRRFLPLKDRSIISEIKNLLLQKFEEIK
jgi:predicted nucleotidyltransferase component of viral defense system